MSEKENDCFDVNKKLLPLLHTNHKIANTMIEHNGLQYSDDRKTVLKYVGSKTILTKDDFLPGTTTIGKDAFRLSEEEVRGIIEANPLLGLHIFLKSKHHPEEVLLNAYHTPALWLLAMRNNSLSRLNGLEIELPESVIKIEDYAFYNSNVRKIEGTKNIVYVGDCAFQYSALGSIELNVEAKIGVCAFSKFAKPQYIIDPSKKKESELSPSEYLTQIYNWRKTNYRGVFPEADKIIKPNFTKLDYNKRKLVFITKDYTNISTDKEFINVFSTDNLPDIFGGGSPVVNTLYVGHPHIPNKYIPFDDYEFEFLVEKTREFCRFVQCLGATEVKILNSNESEEYQHNQSNVNGSANVGIGRFGASANGEHSEELETLNRLKSRVCINQEFTPTRKPYLPDDLVWYQHEPSWQTLYKQRNGLNNHIEVIELSKSSVIKSSESTSVNAELKALFTQVGVSYSEQYQKQLEKSSNAVLRIKVSFAPLETLEATEQTALPSAKLKACLHKYTLQAPLTEREREIICDCYGISDNECKEMEKSVQNFALSDNEKELANQIHKLIDSNSQITDSIRDMLCKFTNVSQAREHEIEDWINCLHTV